MNESSKNQNFKFWFVSFSIFISINFWSFQLIPENIYRALEAILLFVLFIFVIHNYNSIKNKLIFRNSVWLFLLIPVFSTIGAYVFHDQPFYQSLYIIRNQFLWLLYFLLHIFNLPKQKIIKLIVFTGLVWITLTIIQQFTYPRYYFFTRSETDNYSILRSGVYRFMINGLQYGIFVLFYFFHKYLISRKLKYLFYVAFAIIGLYYFGTRQAALAAAACLFITLFIVQGKARINAIVFVIIGLLIIVSFKEILFGQYIEMTNQQLNEEDEIRQISARFWLIEYWPHWSAMVTGNGSPHYLSSYGKEIEEIRDLFKLYRSDVGIIGGFNEYGIFYVFNIIFVNIKGIRERIFVYDDNYLRLFFFFSIILFVTSQGYSSFSSIPFYCLVFYLSDKSYNKKNNKETVSD